MRAVGRRLLCDALQILLGLSSLLYSEHFNINTPSMFSVWSECIPYLPWVPFGILAPPLQVSLTAWLSVVVICVHGMLVYFSLIILIAGLSILVIFVVFIRTHTPILYTITVLLLLLSPPFCHFIYLWHILYTCTSLSVFLYVYVLFVLFLRVICILVCNGFSLRFWV